LKFPICAYVEACERNIECSTATVPGEMGIFVTA